MYMKKDEIKEKIEEENMIQDHVHLETQLKEHRFDLTLSKLEEYKGGGKIDFSNDEKELPLTNEVPTRKKNSDDKYGWWVLSRGNYLAETNETVELPEDTLMIHQPRLSLLNCGAETPVQVITSQETLKPKFMLRIENSNGVEIKENARIVKAIFLDLGDKKPGFIE